MSLFGLIDLVDLLLHKNFEIFKSKNICES